LWLNVVGCVILTVAAGMVLRALVRQRLVIVGRRIPAGVIPWLVVLVGCAGAVLLVVEVFNRDIVAGTEAKVAGTDLFALYWTATMALLLPAWPSHRREVERRSPADGSRPGSRRTCSTGTTTACALTIALLARPLHRRDCWRIS
jgi:hypothetical protein